jgi:hypothetical protein
MHSPIDLTTLIPRCHEASKANGWWEPRPNAGQQLMLVVSELSEALEAHRTGKETNWRGYNSERDNLIASGDLETSYGRERMNIEFRSCIKDSVGDELADAYIRLCDYAGGFGFGVAHLKACYRPVLPLSDNFGECLLGITAGIVLMADEENDQERCAGVSMATIEALCAREGIDLATHIDLKLQYNATRGQKHGGKAY